MAVVEFCTTPGATLDAATRTVTGGGEAQRYAAQVPDAALAELTQYVLTILGEIAQRHAVDSILSATEPLADAPAQILADALGAAAPLIMPAAPAEVS